MKKHAIISNDKKYRFALMREWDNSKPTLGFIMVNPSTADAEKDDPTIRRCISFAKNDGFGSIFVVNLCAYRSTNPKELKTVRDPFGEGNLSWVHTIITKCNKTIIAWGDSIKYIPDCKRYVNSLERIGPLYCFGYTKNGNPKHPLYVSSNTKIIRHNIVVK